MSDVNIFTNPTGCWLLIFAGPVRRSQVLPRKLYISSTGSLKRIIKLSAINGIKAIVIQAADELLPWYQQGKYGNLIAAIGLVISNEIQIDFSARVTVKFDRWSREIIGNLFLLPKTKRVIWQPSMN